MSGDHCPEFLAWLERLPREDLSPTFQQHILRCQQCMIEYGNLEPVISSLNRQEHAAPLSETFLQTLTEQSLARSGDLTNVRLAAALSGISLLCLPVIVLINWFWASLGYSFLMIYVSSTVAYLYLAVFIMTTFLMTTLSYGAVPLMAGLLRGRNVVETKA